MSVIIVVITIVLLVAMPVALGDRDCRRQRQ
jgi:hypothetical protein